jgi:hypothetical protein
MNVTLLLSWWNLIFILPLGLGLLYLGIYTLSGWTFGDADADGAVDHDVDAHLDADGHVSFDHDVDADADADADADNDTDGDAHDADSENESSALMTALGWLGVGRVPVSLMLMVLLLSWGTIGFCANQLLLHRPIIQSILIAIALAAIGSLLIVKLVSSTVARYLPTNETYARRFHELLGSTGEALYPIDEKFGMACGKDDRGERFEVACRTSNNQPPIAKGQPIQLVAYAAKERMFYVMQPTTPHAH